MVEDGRPISRTSPSTCQKIKYNNRSDTRGSCPTSDHRWSATQHEFWHPHARLGAAALARVAERFGLDRQGAALARVYDAAAGVRTTRAIGRAS